MAGGTDIYGGKEFAQGNNATRWLVVCGRVERRSAKLSPHFKMVGVERKERATSNVVE